MNVLLIDYYYDDNYFLLDIVLLSENSLLDKYFITKKNHKIGVQKLECKIIARNEIIWKKVPREPAKDRP